MIIKYLTLACSILMTVNVTAQTKDAILMKVGKSDVSVGEFKFKIILIFNK